MVYCATEQCGVASFCWKAINLEVNYYRADVTQWLRWWTFSQRSQIWVTLTHAHTHTRTHACTRTHTHESLVTSSRASEQSCPIFQKYASLAHLWHEATECTTLKALSYRLIGIILSSSQSSIYYVSLQCFDTVDWASGRASGL